jgi:hypothetical protein
MIFFFEGTLTLSPTPVFWLKAAERSFFQPYPFTHKYLQAVWKLKGEMKKVLVGYAGIKIIEIRVWDEFRAFSIRKNKKKYLCLPR